MLELLPAYANAWFAWVVIAILGWSLHENTKRADESRKAFDTLSRAINALAVQINDSNVKQEAHALAMERILESMDAHDERSRENYRLLSNSIHYVKRQSSNNKLDDEQCYMVVADTVRAASDDKLDFIGGVLRANHIKGNENATSDKIRGFLVERSSRYINDLNKKFVMPIPAMGNWVEKNFEFDMFFGEVMDIVLRDCTDITKEQAILKKTSEIRTVMIRYQNMMMAKLKKTLEDNSINYP